MKHFHRRELLIRPLTRVRTRPFDGVRKHMQTGLWRLRKFSCPTVLTGCMAAFVGSAGAQTVAPPARAPGPITVYLQATDARFDSYLYVKKIMFPNHQPEIADEFFFIPRANSKEREKEFANWRRQFNMIVSAAALSENVLPKISTVRDEFSKAQNASECWIEDKLKERRITVTLIGSADMAAAETEYRAVSKEFFADPESFRCRYTYKVGPNG